MVHFRTLDWDMPSLRRVLVILEFVLEPKGEVVASSITCAGFVGVLTGVRKDSSMSLNFRRVRGEGSGSSWMGDLRYYVHLGMVLLGLKPSISSILRRHLLPHAKAADALPRRNGTAVLSSYTEVAAAFSCCDRPLLTTCYLCFSSGRETTIIEKGLITAKQASSTEFIVVTNADAVEPGRKKKTIKTSAGKSRTAGKIPQQPATALEELIQDANERKACAEKNYRSLLRRQSKFSRQTGGLESEVGSSALLPTVDYIVALVQKYPTTNECIHFAAVLDPQEGMIAWCRYWPRPIDEI